ncbi:MAG: MBL fold metallo-hydrolase [Candidatus Methanoperedens sp.]|nr:MBL fold metallo-hydrolase [Candidatus Methanoperedens sp.]
MNYTVVPVILLLILFILLLFLIIRFNKGKRKAQIQWQQSSVKKISGFGATKSLEILPIIDWHTNRSDLKVETGVSYLIKTDNNSILFDTGLNFEQSDPSPLVHNMGKMGISLADIDSIVISHNHLDHVGGLKWQKQKTFSLTSHQINLGNKAVYTPTPMIYPGLSPIYAQNPTVIAHGVATTGIIPNQDFISGRIQEQSIAVNVEGKGIVLIIGCGHQTLPKILARAQALFEEPIYGIIGGLHYPVSDSPAKIFGIKIQKYVGTCKFPWKPITMDEVNKNVDILKKVNPKIVGLSPHDSCDASIATFRKAFQNEYKDIIVGEKIEIH